MPRLLPAAVLSLPLASINNSVLYNTRACNPWAHKLSQKEKQENTFSFLQLDRTSICHGHVATDIRALKSEVAAWSAWGVVSKEEREAGHVHCATVAMRRVVQQLPILDAQACQVGIHSACKACRTVGTTDWSCQRTSKL